jgi:uncharacterized delta-60 repeat protein
MVSRALLLRAVVGAVAMLAARRARAFVPGDLDPSFHDGSPVLFHLATGDPPFTSFAGVTLDSEGRTLTTGSTRAADGSIELVAVRALADGAVDPAFGAGGSLVVQLALGGSPISIGERIGPRPAGGWLIVGRGTGADSRDTGLVAALDANGMLDVGFGSGGAVRPQLAGASPAVMSALGGAVAADGSSFIAGTVDDDPMTPGTRLVVAKLAATGLPSTGFGNQPSQGAYVNGFAQVPQGESSASDVLETASGLLVVGSTLDQAAKPEMLLLRLTGGGTGDPSFAGGAGFVRVQAADPTAMPAGSSNGRRLARGPAEEIYALGEASDGDGRPAIAVARFTTGGVLDSTFGTLGVRRVQTASGMFGQSSGADLVVQPDGRIVIVGTSIDNGSEFQLVVLRLETNGDLDPTFGVGGVVRPALGPRTFGAGIALSADARTAVVTGAVSEAPPSSVQRGLVTRVLLEILPSTTTTTTLPPCDPAPSLVGARCRLTRLAAAVDAGLPPGRLERRLGRTLDRAAFRLGSADGLAGRAFRRKLRRAGGQLRRLHGQLGRPAAVRVIASDVRARLLADTDALVAETGELLAAGDVPRVRRLSGTRSRPLRRQRTASAMCAIIPRIASVPVP